MFFLRVQEHFLPEKSWNQSLQHQMYILASVLFYVITSVPFFLPTPPPFSRSPSSFLHRLRFLLVSLLFNTAAAPCLVLVPPGLLNPLPSVTLKTCKPDHLHLWKKTHQQWDFSWDRISCQSDGCS